MKFWNSFLTLFISFIILNSCVWDAVDALVDVVDPPEEMETTNPTKHDYSDVDDVEMEEISDLINFPDDEAVFMGGTEEMMKWIQMNLQYPAKAIENNEQGKVYVSFVVRSDGTIKNVEIERSVSPSLDRETKRVIRCMPKWRPAKVDGKRVSTQCRLPIVFTLE